MLTLADRLTPAPDVITTELAGDAGPEGVLLHLGTSHYFSLNPTGLAIWQRLDDGLPLADIAAQLTETFDVGQAQAEQSVLRLAQELLDAQLVAMAAD